MADSDGYITTISKANKIKTRFRVGNDFVGLTAVGGRLAIMQRNAIAFSTVIDGKLSPAFCELGANGEELVAMTVETFRSKQNYLYALTTKGNVVVYKYTLPSSGREQNECELKSVIELP